MLAMKIRAEFSLDQSGGLTYWPNLSTTETHVALLLIISQYICISQTFERNAKQQWRQTWTFKLSKLITIVFLFVPFMVALFLLNDPSRTLVRRRGQHWVLGSTTWSRYAKCWRKLPGNRCTTVLYRWRWMPCRNIKTHRWAKTFKHHIFARQFRGWHRFHNVLIFMTRPCQAGDDKCRLAAPGFIWIKL